MTTKPEGPREEHDDVATLLKLAGPRPAVPAERAERVRATAFAIWKREAQGRSRRRQLWMAATVATAGGLVLAIAFWLVPFSSGPELSSPTFTVVSLSGTAWVRDPEGADPSRSVPLTVGDPVALGSELDTGDEGRIAFGLSSGHSVRLDRSTRIRVQEGGVIGLDRGAVYVDSGLHEVTGIALSIHTALGNVEETGTQFEVRLAEDSLRVRLREGSLVVHQDLRMYELAVGSELDLGEDGLKSTRVLPTHGPDWGWIEDVTPMLDLEGRSAREFLEWVARERGWTLSFADDEVERSAEEITLSGTVESLTLDESLDAVLPTCRMVYTVTHGVLRIDAGI